MAVNYQVLPGYQRFNQMNNALMRAVWDPVLKPCREREERSIRKYLETDAPGFDLRDWAFDFASSAAVSAFGTGINKPNSGFTAWGALDAKYNRTLPRGVGKFDASDPARTRRSVEKVARFLGADLVGFTPLDPRWVYSHHYTPWDKENRNPPVEIPEEMNQVIILGLGMDHEMFRTAPSAVMMSETHRNYSHMAVLTASLAEFIRTLGYRAIPSLNDTALNVPLAVDAGLGQPSRLGLVITPEFGPRVRFCKVITDLPLDAKKRHADFGVIEFCEACERCVQACPVKAVSAGGRTTEGRNLSSNPGVLKWYLDAEKCRLHFAHVATNCGICLRSCPFNHGRGPHHWLAERLVRLRWRWVNRLLVKLHGWLGYGEQKDPRLFWDGAAG